MGDINETFRQLQLATLEDVKKRDLLNEGIAKLEHDLDNPSKPINIDFDAIREEASKDMKFLEECERKRIGKQGGIHERRL
jgi:hypothetical protein